MKYGCKACGWTGEELSSGCPMCHRKENLEIIDKLYKIFSYDEKGKEVAVFTTDRLVGIKALNGYGTVFTYPIKENGFATGKLSIYHKA